MKSSNPVFARSAEFNGRGGAIANDPSQWQVDLNGSPTHTQPGTGRMTIDSVVEKTAITLGLLTVAAAVTWFAIGDVIDPTTGEAVMGKAMTFAMVGVFVGFALAMVNSFKKVVSPALVLAYAVFEGVFIGAFSKVIAAYVGETSIVFQAVLGTVVAFAGTLAAYKFFNIQVTDKFRKVMMISGFAIIGVLLINMVLSLTGVFESGGLRGFNTLGLLVSCALVVYATFCLILDFDYAEKGIQAGLPERESWRVAFGLTVTLVWIYIEILRILAILRGD
ncbi:Bax inhibitor-1/YccA family protein [Aeromicrobium fastidiosum]|uniref:Bax inhibitor-1/YccA family protein n=1 Tax=Aeromicrobium fastidiosum TaxID=52699 RepID=A0A641ALF4_9ACTN|nr:Bax inhibitor-1/YccA family protein [Aeromicrobium fastidiosum]KAA1378118.1 Bax inhibitor-1/YccA family protein [Aeromicrobium fastidiosum]MBP2389084.1 putative YccA/Bax inhibitor family protein [Aeromicrobium fastidiosum]